jgi:hypothetical protein
MVVKRGLSVRCATGAARILSIDELETGLRLLGRGQVEHNAFWDENVAAFRQTVLVAIRDTTEDLLSPGIAERWRILLQRQLESLVQYLELADRYIERRDAITLPRRPEFPPASNRLQ